MRSQKVLLESFTTKFDLGSPYHRSNFWVSEGHKCLWLRVEMVLVPELARASPVMARTKDSMPNTLTFTLGSTS